MECNKYKTNFENIVMESAVKIYGSPLPKPVSERIEKELETIKSHGFIEYYKIASLLADKSRKEGYSVSSRFGIGSVLSAFFAGMTTVNTLAPHYVCKHCHHTEFTSDASIKDGFDLPDKNCPVCGERLYGDGHNIPFESFISFDGSKSSKIILTFSDEYQPEISQYYESLNVPQKENSAFSSINILGHIHLTMLKNLEEFTGIIIDNVPMNDKSVYSLLTSPNALGIDRDSHRLTGTLGLTELSSDYVQDILFLTDADSFSDLVKVSGLSHGTDVWMNNTEFFVRNRIFKLSEIEACREDIFDYLTENGINRKTAYNIMETVRKGLLVKGKTTYLEWQEYEQEMFSHGIPVWYTISLSCISYMLPRAHAVSLATMAIKLGWYKLYYPAEFYAAYLTSTACDGWTEDKDILSLIIAEARDRRVVFLPAEKNCSDKQKYLPESGNVRLPLYAETNGAFHLFEPKHFKRCGNFSGVYPDNPCFETGFKNLDNILGPLQKGSVYLLGARPGMGKTAFVADVARNLSKKIPVYFISAGETTRKIKRRFFNNFQDGKIYIKGSSSGLTEISEMISKIKNSVIIIDGMYPNENAHYLPKLEKSVKSANNIIIFCTMIPCSPEDRGDSRPILSDLSDNVVRCSDAVIFLYRKPYYDCDNPSSAITEDDPLSAEMIVAKNKFGDTGTAKIHWNPEKKHYENI